MSGDKSSGDFISKAKPKAGRADSKGESVDSDPSKWPGITDMDKLETSKMGTSVSDMSKVL